ncbi:MAG TPA: ABC-F family ATP-binding cassette domain-containing protein [Alphaproteobacteria bacterium]|nr:ABC-F family ATP-binding cassette domain-containing protein [Alphaproteobacteria bacterium]
MLQITDVTYRIAGRTLLENASAVIPTGHKAGLVGPNGAGKSTLLKLLTGSLVADGGEVSMTTGARVGSVAQEMPGGKRSLIDTVLDADIERAALLAEAEQLESPDYDGDPMRIAHVHQRLADIDAYSAPARAAEILAGLGFDETAQNRACSEFSGGWRMRVALAAALFAGPDILMLDEPTNHLDLEAAIWLESYLKDYAGTLLIVSHDREFLNAIPDMIVHLEQGKLVTYRGNYDQFRRQRAERQANQAAAIAKQSAARAHMEDFVRRFRAKATKARQAQSRLKALQKMETLAPLIEDRVVRFDFPTPAPLSPPLVTLDHADVGYDGRPVLRGLNLRIDGDDRIALLGANGNGKSTLVKLLAGRLQTMAGQLNKSGKLKVGYFAQHQADEFDLDLTALAQAKKTMPGVVEEKVRAHLGRFGFSQERSNTKVGSLSGGEKARLLFALMAREAPNILLLDEPTNHLDVESREALIHALNDYEGAVILVTHDPHLVELAADRLWLVADGKVVPYDGDLDDYRKLLLDKRRADRRSGKDERKAAKQRETDRKSTAEIRAQLAPLRKAVEVTEAAVNKITKEIAALDRKLEDPELYSGPATIIAALQTERGAAATRLAVAEEKWLEASAALEAADPEAQAA